MVSDDVVDLTIAVIDTGEGIDDHKMQALFGAYETTQKVNKFGSTGLGLHIAQVRTPCPWWAARVGGRGRQVGHVGRSPGLLLVAGVGCRVGEEAQGRWF